MAGKIVKSERINVLTETENKSFVHAIVNAVTKGYADNTIIEDIMDLVRRKEISKGVLQSSSDALRSYGDSFSTSLNFLADSIDQLEVIDEPMIRMKEKTQVIEDEISEEDENIPADDENVEENPDGNVVKKEMENIEDKEQKIEDGATDNEEVVQNKKSSIEKFASLHVSEDWDRYKYDNKANVMSGLLVLSFNENMNNFKKDNKMNLPQNDVDVILNKVYSYCKNEFKKLKADLNPSIFKSNIRFIDLEKGKAEVDYEIKGAF